MVRTALRPRRRPGLAQLLFLLLLAGCGGATTAVQPTLSPQALQGEQVFKRVCSSCHSQIENVIIVGPSLAGVASRAGERVPGQDARAYLLASVEAPDAFLVPGFDNLMPKNLSKTLTGADIDAVVAYLLTLE